MHPRDENVHRYQTTLDRDPASDQPNQPENWHPDAEPVMPVDETYAAPTPSTGWTGTDRADEQRETDGDAVDERDGTEPVAGGSAPAESAESDRRADESIVDGGTDTVEPYPSAGLSPDPEPADAELTDREPAEEAVHEPVPGETGVVVVEPAGDPDSWAGPTDSPLDSGAETAQPSSGDSGMYQATDTATDGVAGAAPTEGDRDGTYGGSVDQPFDGTAGVEPAGEPAGADLAGAEVAGIEHAADDPVDGQPVDGSPVAAVPAVAVAAPETTPGGLAAEQDRPLVAAGDLSGLRDRWRDVQAGFVDDPAAAVAAAADLVDEAVRALTSGLAELRNSVGEQAGAEPQTERLRVAVRRYRTVFDRLLSD